MDLRRIEAALRDGPADEPIYAPGTFRRGPMPGWLLAVMGSALVGAIVLGVVIGLEVSALRAPGAAPPTTPVASPSPGPSSTGSGTLGQLQGYWVSASLSRDDLVNTLVSDGYDPAEIQAFLDKYLITGNVQFELAIRGEQVTVYGVSVDISRTLSIGQLRLRDDGRLEFDRAGLGFCFGRAPFVLDHLAGSADGRLAFYFTSTEGCADFSIVVSAFLDGAGPYEFQPRPLGG